MKAVGEKNINEITPLKDIREYLAIERTELALETTQLSWVRTTLAFITTGIAVSKGIEALSNAEVITGEDLIKHANLIGILLATACSITFMVVTFNYVMRTKQLAKLRGGVFSRIIPTLIISLFTIIIGLKVSFLLIIL